MSYLPSSQELLFHYIAKGECSEQIAKRFNLHVADVRRGIQVAKIIDEPALNKFRKWGRIHVPGEPENTNKTKKLLEMANRIFFKKSAPEEKEIAHSRLSFPEQLLAARITSERIKICNENFK